VEAVSELELNARIIRSGHRAEWARRISRVFLSDKSSFRLKDVPMSKPRMMLNQLVGSLEKTLSVLKQAVIRRLVEHEVIERQMTGFYLTAYAEASVEWSSTLDTTQRHSSESISIQDQRPPLST